MAGRYGVTFHDFLLQSTAVKDEFLVNKETGEIYYKNKNGVLIDYSSVFGRKEAIIVSPTEPSLEGRLTGDIWLSNKADGTFGISRFDGTGYVTIGNALVDSKDLVDTDNPEFDISWINTAYDDLMKDIRDLEPLMDAVKLLVADALAKLNAHKTPVEGEYKHSTIEVRYGTGKGSVALETKLYEVKHNAMTTKDTLISAIEFRTGEPHTGGRTFPDIAQAVGNIMPSSPYNEISRQMITLSESVKAGDLVAPTFNDISFDAKYTGNADILGNPERYPSLTATVVSVDTTETGSKIYLGLDKEPFLEEHALDLTGKMRKIRDMSGVTAEVKRVQYLKGTKELAVFTANTVNIINPVTNTIKTITATTAIVDGAIIGTAVILVHDTKITVNTISGDNTLIETQSHDLPADTTASIVVGEKELVAAVLYETTSTFRLFTFNPGNSQVTSEEHTPNNGSPVGALDKKRTFFIEGDTRIAVTTTALIYYYNITSKTVDVFSTTITGAAKAMTYDPHNNHVYTLNSDAINAKTVPSGAPSVDVLSHTPLLTVPSDKVLWARYIPYMSVVLVGLSVQPFVKLFTIYDKRATKSIEPVTPVTTPSDYYISKSSRTVGPMREYIVDGANTFKVVAQGRPVKYVLSPITFTGKTIPTSHTARKISPDGKLIAVYNPNGGTTAIIFTLSDVVATYQTELTLTGVRTVEFSPDGKYMILRSTNSGNVVYSISGATYTQVSTVPHATISTYYPLEFTPDSKKLLFIYGTTIKAYKINAGVIDTANVLTADVAPPNINDYRFHNNTIIVTGTNSILLYSLTDTAITKLPAIKNLPDLPSGTITYSGIHVDMDANGTYAVTSAMSPDHPIMLIRIDGVNSRVLPLMKDNDIVKYNGTMYFKIPKFNDANRIICAYDTSNVNYGPKHVMFDMSSWSVVDETTLGGATTVMDVNPNGDFVYTTSFNTAFVTNVLNKPKDEIRTTSYSAQTLSSYKISRNGRFVASVHGTNLHLTDTITNTTNFIPIPNPCERYILEFNRRGDKLVLIGKSISLNEHIIQIAELDMGLGIISKINPHIIMPITTTGTNPILVGNAYVDKDDSLWLSIHYSTLPSFLFCGKIDELTDSSKIIPSKSKYVTYSIYVSDDGYIFTIGSYGIGNHILRVTHKDLLYKDDDGFFDSRTLVSTEKLASVVPYFLEREGIIVSYNSSHGTVALHLDNDKKIQRTVVPITGGHMAMVAPLGNNSLIYINSQNSLKIIDEFWLNKSNPDMSLIGTGVSSPWRKITSNESPYFLVGVVEEDALKGATIEVPIIWKAL